MTKVGTFFDINKSTAAAIIGGGRVVVLCGGYAVTGFGGFAGEGTSAGVSGVGSASLYGV